jgi:hypothetical protein
MNAPRPIRGPLRFLPALTLVAVLTITASAEFELARTVLDLPPYIAWALPVAVDSYVLAALRSGRDVVPALAVMAGSLAASMWAHVAAASSDGPLPGHVVAPAATGIMTVLVVVAWRVHVLIEYALAPALHSGPDARTGTASTGTPAPITLVPSSPRAAAPALRAVAPPTDVDGPPSKSDAEILAEIGSPPPSIRQLKRQYAIGQTRATRIHQTATVKSSRSKSQSVIQERIEIGEGTNVEGVNEESEVTTKSNTHTCITDGVGPTRAPGDGVAGGDDRPQLTTGDGAEPR